jgi:signal transduction histidine kinase
MRLGTKFVLLIVGTLAAPLLAMSLVALIAFVGLPDRIGQTETFRTMLAMNGLRHRTVDPATVPGILRTAGPDNDLLVFDENGKVTYSSLTSDSLLSMLQDTHRLTHTFTRFLLTGTDGKQFGVIVGLHTGSDPRPWLRGVAFIIVIGSLVGFMALMSIFIIRSINSSIARLEEGTRRISAGDLDFELPVTSGDRIASLTSSFEQMRRRVRQDAEARSRFIMSVSHDLKTPLSSITGYLDAIDDGMAEEPAQMTKYLAIIRDKTGLLESRISQLIDYVKLETGEWKRSREEMPLASFLQEAITVFASEAEARGYTLATSCDVPESILVSMDADLVFRALENLMQNAFRYSEPGTALRFTAQKETDCVRLRIVNRGSIAEKDLPFIFEPFYRGTRSRREAGFGLGLSVVKWVASSHGWSLNAESRSGDTTFTIGIPLAPVPGEK